MGFTTAPLADAIAIKAAEKAFKDKRSKTLYAAEKGSLPFIKANETNEVKYGFCIVQGDFCQNATEINDAKNRVISFKDVFNSWKRFSHKNNSPQPSLPAELLGWKYTEATDTIESTINSGSLIGLVSREKYSNYELEVYLSSTYNDDDSMGIVIAFDTNANGIEQTITAQRSPGGNGFSWQVTLNYVNAKTGVITTRILSNTTQLSALKWGSGNVGATAAAAGYTNNMNGAWPGMGRTKVYVKRVGDTITLMASDFEHWDPTMAYVPASLTTINLKSNVDLTAFRTEAAYGFSAYSQPNASYKVINFISGNRAVYDVAANVTHVFDGTSWNIDPNRKISDDIGVGRLLFNRFTGKLFYNDTDTDVYHLNSISANPPPPSISKYIAYDNLTPPNPFIAVTEDGFGKVVYDGGFPKFYNSLNPTANSFSELTSAGKYLHNALKWVVNPTKIDAGNKKILFIGDTIDGVIWSVKGTGTSDFYNTIITISSVAQMQPTVISPTNFDGARLDVTLEYLDQFAAVVFFGSAVGLGEPAITQSAINALLTYRKNGNGLIFITDHGQFLTSIEDTPPPDTGSTLNLEGTLNFFRTVNAVVYHFGAYFTGYYDRVPVNVGFLRETYGDHPLYANLLNSEYIYASDSESKVVVTLPNT